MYPKLENKPLGPQAANPEQQESILGFAVNFRRTRLGYNPIRNIEKM